MSTDGQGTKWHRNIAENFHRLSRAHESYRRQTDRQTTDGRAIIYKRSRSLKTALNYNDVTICMTSKKSKLHFVHNSKNQERSISNTFFLNQNLCVVYSQSVLTFEQFKATRLRVYCEFVKQESAVG